jgi:hypothetical protein
LERPDQRPAFPSTVTEKLTMRYALATAAALAASLLSTSAYADPYRWCAVYGGFRSGGSENCYFMTLAQFRAQIQGIGGFCRPNPFYDGRPVRTPEDYDDSPRRRRHR